MSRGTAFNRVGGACLLVLLAQSTLVHASSPAAAAAAALTDEQRVHAFYYVWYGHPDTDGAYKHWDHQVLPHWSAQERDKHEHGTRFKPPGSLHSPFYPLGGPYSSSDPATIRNHIAQMVASNIGVLVISWWGPAWRAGTHDTQGVNTDAVLGVVLHELEQQQQVKLAFHMEPYEGRTVETVREDLQHLMARHGASPALLRLGGRPVYYLYDSYRIPPEAWARLLTPSGDLTVRGTDLDGVFIGLVLSAADGADLMTGGMDGAYTYFADQAVSWASNPDNWPQLTRWAEEHGRLFIASVGPGYDDSKIRPWNAAATRSREDGARYRRVWRAAAASGAHAVSVSTFNEWGEGTQIEPAQPWTDPGTGQASQDYGPDPWLYLNITQAEAAAFTRAWHDRGAEGSVHGSEPGSRQEEL